MFVHRVMLAAVSIATAWTAMPALGADACSNRGELDAMYCDANKDLVADVPTDPKKWKDPSTIVFTYTPVEDPAVYENIFKPFTTYLAKCLDKKVVFYQVQSNAAEIEAMRSGRLHVAGAVYYCCGRDGAISSPSRPPPLFRGPFPCRTTLCRIPVRIPMRLGARLPTWSCS